MLINVLFALWFFLPAGLANTAPVVVAKIPVFKRYSYPVDFYKTIGGKRILGDHKTIRGFIAGIITAITVTLLQQYIYVHSEFVRSVVRIDYTQFNAFIFGLLSALGALGGDSIKSFFKRRSSIKPGHAWIPFDQIDYIIGGIIMTIPYVTLTVSEYLVIFTIWTILHPLSTITGYLLKLKDKPI